MWVTTGHSSFLHQNLSRYQNYNDTGFTNKISIIVESSPEFRGSFLLWYLPHVQWFECWKCVLLHSYFVLYLTFVSCCCLTHCFSCTLLSRPHLFDLPSSPLSWYVLNPYILFWSFFLFPDFIFIFIFLKWHMITMCHSRLLSHITSLFHTTILYGSA